MWEPVSTLLWSFLEEEADIVAVKIYATYNYFIHTIDNNENAVTDQ